MRFAPFRTLCSPAPSDVLSSVLLVDNSSALHRFSDEWLPRIDSAVISVDIEEERGNTYHPRVALLQVSVDGEDAILDPVKLGAHALEPAVETILLTASLVIVHGGRNDVSGLRRDFGVGPHRLADTQIAARFLGTRQFGLSALLSERFDITLDKETRRSDWAARPLTPTQVEYARNDTRYLEQLWRQLAEETKAAGWADAVQEECDALGSVPAEQATFDPLGWLKIKGMNARPDAVRLRAAQIWLWRDQLGARFNVHPSQVVPSWALEQAAIRGETWLQSQTSVMKRIQALDPEAFDTLREVVAHERDLPISRPRERKDCSLTVNSEAMRARLEALMAWRERVSEETGMEPGWLAPRAVLEDVSRATPENLLQLAEHTDVREWRLRRYADAWDEILKRNR